jgi:hypothetical protein
MPSNKSFTRQRLYTSPRAADDAGGADAPRDGGVASDASGPDGGSIDARG